MKTILLLSLVLVLVGCGKAPQQANTPNTYWVAPGLEYVCTGDLTITYVNGNCTCSASAGGYSEGCLVSHPQGN